MVEASTKNTSMKETILRAIAVVLVVVGIVCNEWVLAALFSADGVLARSTRIAIWVFDLGMIILGVLIYRARKRLTLDAERLRKGYTGIAIFTFNTLLLILLANLAVYLLRPGTPLLPSNSFTIQELVAKDTAALHRIYPGRSLQEVLELRHDPGDVAHPTLEFMETPVQSKYYNVGVENMRYTKYVRGEHAKEKISGATWVLGGSTTFGHGVSDDETIPYYLNELDTGSVYINFAGEAYHQSLEIDKLLLLLKKGYTAKRVVFVDGLNDIVVMKESNFPPAETPMRFYDAYGYVTNMERLKTPEYELILGRLPIFDWLQSELETRKFKDVSVSEANGYDDIYSSGSLYHENPILHYKLTLAASQDYGDALRNISWYEDKILSYYRLNDGFLQAIARAFGFQYYVFFQPQANLSPRNPFHRDSVHYAEDPRYRYCQLMVEKVREAIREGSLPNFYDISDVDADCQDCYVDFTHYNPRLCKLIAESIIMRIHERDAHRK